MCAFHDLKITITRWIVRYLQVYDLVWATPRAMLGGQPGRRGRVCGCVRSISSTVRVCPPSVARSAGISLVFANGCRGPAARPGVSPAASPNKMPRYALAVARPMGRRSALRRYQPYTWLIAPVRISTHLCGRLTDLFVSMSVYSKLDIEEDIHTTKLILSKGRVNLEPVAKKLTAP